MVVAKQHPGIRRRALGARFRPRGHGWEVASFVYRAWRWPHARRLVVVRRPRPDDPTEAAQLPLFCDRRYAYAVLVTNLCLNPWRGWRFYAQRATVEKLIRELLYDLPLNQIPTAQWLANVAYFHLRLLAYNLVHWFKRLCLPRAYANAPVETVRREFLVLPGRLTHPAGQPVLQWPRAYPLRAACLAAARKGEPLSVPRD